MDRLPRDERLCALRYARPTVGQIVRRLRDRTLRHGSIAWLLAARALRLSELRAWEGPGVVLDPETFLETLVTRGKPRDVRAMIEAGWTPSDYERRSLGFLASHNADPVSMLRGLRRTTAVPRKDEYPHGAWNRFVTTGPLKQLTDELKRWHYSPTVYRNSDGITFVMAKIAVPAIVT